MLPPRWKKILADLWENKVRSLMVIASITIGTFAVGMIAVAYVILPEGMHTSYKDAVPANIKIKTDDFDEDLINTIEKLDGVADVEGRSSFSVRVRVKGKSENWQNLNITAIQDFEQQTLKLLEVDSGKAVPDENEILLLESALDKIDVSLGDTLEIKLSDNSIEEFEVVGITHDYTIGLASVTNSKVGYINADDLETLNEPKTYDTLLITVEGDRNDEEYIRRVNTLVNDKVEANGKMIYSSEISIQSLHPFANYMNAVMSILGIMGILTVILSSFLIFNTMNSLMSQQLRQIGIIKLIGGKRKQVISIYLTLVFVYGLISFIIAVPTSAFVSFQISSEVADMLNGKLLVSNSVPLIPFAILVQAAVALIVPLLAALIPILQGSGVTVQRALNGSMIRESGETNRFDAWLESLGWQNGILVLAVRNTFRRKGRLALTLFTLSLGGAIFIAVFNVQVALDHQVERILSYGSADAYLDFSKDYPMMEIEEQALSIPGVSDIETWLTAQAQLEENGQTEVVTILAPPLDTNIVEQSVTEGRWVLPEEYRAMVVNEAFLNTYPGLEPGDEVTLKINQKEDQWVITGIFHYTGMDYKLAYTNYSTLEEILDVSQRASSYRVMMDTHSLEYQTQKSEELDTHFRDNGYKVSNVTPVKDRSSDATEKLDMVIFVLLVTAVLTGLVGSVGLSGTLSLNVLERTSEIGILRAIGAHNIVVARLVMIEGMLIGMASYVIGAIFSFPITKILADVVNMAIFSAPSEFAVTSRGFLLWLGIVIVFSLTASFFPARNATRMTIREVLAYE